MSPWEIPFLFLLWRSSVSVFCSSPLYRRSRHLLLQKSTRLPLQAAVLLLHSLHLLHRGLILSPRCVLPLPPFLLFLTGSTFFSASSLSTGRSSPSLLLSLFPSAQFQRHRSRRSGSRRAARASRADPGGPERAAQGTVRVRGSRAQARRVRGRAAGGAARLAGPAQGQQQAQEALRRAWPQAPGGAGSAQG
jgi:hypothetical protein